MTKAFGAKPDRNEFLSTWKERRDEELEERIRSLSHSLARVLRHQLNRERGNFTVQEARRIAKMQLCRQGRPASRLGAEGRQAFEADLEAFASELKDPTRPAEIARFSQACVRAAFLRQPKNQALNVRVAKNERLSDLAKAAIRSEYLGATSDESVVQRAVTRLIKERRRGQRGFASVPLEDRDLVRELLDLPRMGKVALPSNDIRVHLARAASGVSSSTSRIGRFRRAGSTTKKNEAQEKNTHSLGETLRHAALFSEAHLQDALGDEILLLGQPVGFTCARRRAVLFFVRSSAAAHQLSMRRQELLHRFQQVPGFESVVDIRTEVRGHTRTKVLRPNGPRKPIAPRTAPRAKPSKNHFPTTRPKTEAKNTTTPAFSQVPIEPRNEQGVEPVDELQVAADSPKKPTSEKRLQDVIARLRARANGEID